MNSNEAYNDQRFYMDESSERAIAPKEEINSILEELIFDKTISIEHTAKIARVRTLIAEL